MILKYRTLPINSSLRYIKDLLPDLPSHPAALRATIRSPTVISEADLSLWRDGRGSKRGQVAALGKVGFTDVII